MSGEIKWALFNNRYREDGHTIGEPAFAPPNPIKLQWELSDEVSLLSLLMFCFVVKL